MWKYEKGHLKEPHEWDDWIGKHLADTYWSRLLVDISFSGPKDTRLITESLRGRILANLSEACTNKGRKENKV